MELGMLRISHAVTWPFGGGEPIGLAKLSPLKYPNKEYQRLVRSVATAGKKDLVDVGQQLVERFFPQKKKLSYVF